MDDFSKSYYLSDSCLTCWSHHIPLRTTSHWHPSCTCWWFVPHFALATKRVWMSISPRSLWFLEFILAPASLKELSLSPPSTCCSFFLLIALSPLTDCPQVNSFYWFILVALHQYLFQYLITTSTTTTTTRTTIFFLLQLHIAFESFLCSSWEILLKARSIKMLFSNFLIISSPTDHSARIFLCCWQ